MIAEAKDTVAGVEEHVHWEGFKTMYHLLWDNPNASKRKRFRAKMKELMDEDAF